MAFSVSVSVFILLYLTLRVSFISVSDLMVFINAYINKPKAMIPKKRARFIMTGLGSKHIFSSHAIYSWVFKDFNLFPLL